MTNTRAKYGSDRHWENRYMSKTWTETWPTTVHSWTKRNTVILNKQNPTTNMLILSCPNTRFSCSEQLYMPYFQSVWASSFSSFVHSFFPFIYSTECWKVRKWSFHNHGNRFMETIFLTVHKLGWCDFRRPLESLSSAPVPQPYKSAKARHFDLDSAENITVLQTATAVEENGRVNHFYTHFLKIWAVFL